MAHPFIASIATATATLAVGLFLSAPAIAQRAPVLPRTLDGKPDLSGVWAGPGFKHVGGAKYSDIAAPALIRFPEDKDLPFKPGGETLWNFKLNGEAQHDDPTLFCLPIGFPYNGLTARAQQWVQAPGLLVIVYEDYHTTRIIHMDGRPHPTDLEPTFMGNSVGKYEGDTAVIDTIGLKAWHSDMHRNHMHTEAAHYIERIRRTGPTTMTYELTTDDPMIFTKPWTSGPWTMHLHKDWEILEDVCEENNQDPRLTSKFTNSK